MLVQQHKSAKQNQAELPRHGMASSSQHQGGEDEGEQCEDEDEAAPWLLYICMPDRRQAYVRAASKCKRWDRASSARPAAVASCIKGRRGTRSRARLALGGCTCTAPGQPMVSRSAACMRDIIYPIEAGPIHLIGGAT